MLLAITCSKTHVREAYPFHRIEMIKDNGDGRALVYVSDRRGEPILTLESFDELIRQPNRTARHMLSNPWPTGTGTLTEIEAKELQKLQKKAMDQHTY